MNLVVLSTCSPTNAFLINELARRHPVSHVVRVTWEQEAKSGPRLSKFAKSPLSSMLRLVRRKYFERLHERTECESMAWLGRSPDETITLPTTNVDRLRINSREVADLLRDLAPDVLLVSACPILKANIFEIPRLGTINVHRGIAPAYRGERTLFWPLYNHDQANLGVTLHLIDRGIDTGPVLRHGFPSLERDDAEGSINAKCVQLAVEMLDDILKNCESEGLSGVRQNGAGRCYYSREQRLWKEACYRLLHTIGRRPINPREQRVVSYRPTVVRQLQSLGV